MAPIKDDTVDSLRDLVKKLEARVEQLEAKVQQAGGDVTPRAPKSTVESIRMILMGPPGAGKSSDIIFDLTEALIECLGKGTQAPKIKEKYCACHLVRDLR